MRKNPSPPAYQAKKLKEYLERIARYAENVEPKNFEKAKAMIAVMRMSAEAALERFEDSDNGY